MFNINTDLSSFFGIQTEGKEKPDYPRRAMTRSAGHGCINTRPVAVVDPVFEGEIAASIDRIRSLYKHLIGQLITKQYHVVTKDLWKLELGFSIDETNRTSLRFSSLRKWLYKTNQTPARIQLVVEGLSALKVTQTDEEFNQMLMQFGWIPAQFNDFTQLILEFAQAKADECSAYFFSIMDQQQDHSADRFERFIHVQQSFVNRLKGLLPKFSQRSSEFHATKNAIELYRAKHLELFTPRDPSAPKLTEEELKERSHVNFYRGVPMVKHSATDDAVSYAHPYGSGRVVCETAQRSFSSKVRVLDLSLKMTFAVKGLCHHFVNQPQEAHIFPGSKMFSRFSLYIADQLGLKREEAFAYMRALIDEFTHKSIFADTFEVKLNNSVARIKDSKKNPKVQFAMIFMMLEYIALCEASKTNHMPSYYNQKTDHLSESKTKSEDQHTTTDPLARRIVVGLHRLFDHKIAVTPKNVIESHMEYFQSVKRACKEWFDEKRDQKFESPRLAIKEALGMVGAFDHLLAVYRVEQKYLGRISPLTELNNDTLFSIMEEWAEKRAQENQIDLRGKQ